MAHSHIKIVHAKDRLQKPIQEAARIIQRGGVVVFPTTGLYGIGADACNSAAVARVFGIKQRFLDKPISVLVKDRGSVDLVAKSIPRAAQILMDRFWPGNITLILTANPHVLELLTAGSGKIGIRVPAHPVAAALLENMDGPVTATSANLSGHSGCSAISDLHPDIIRGVDLVLDGGTLKGGMGSTVIDVTVDPPKILREGAVPAADVLAVL